MGLLPGPVPQQCDVPKRAGALRHVHKLPALPPANLAATPYATAEPAHLATATPTPDVTAGAIVTGTTNAATAAAATFGTANAATASLATPTVSTTAATGPCVVPRDLRDLLRRKLLRLLSAVGRVQRLRLARRLLPGRRMLVRRLAAATQLAAALATTAAAARVAATSCTTSRASARLPAGRPSQPATLSARPTRNALAAQ